MLSYRDYLDYAEKCLAYVEDKSTRTANKEWLLIPATILAWSAVESFVNNMLDDFSSLPKDMFPMHERAFLLEKRMKFMDSGKEIGNFVLEGTEYRKLENKIFFLISKFGRKVSQNVKGKSLWQDFQKFKDARDALVHPRRDREIALDPKKVERFIETSKAIIVLVSENVWRKKVSF